MFGTYLLEKGHITSPMLKEALKIQANSKRKKLGRLLVELGDLSQQELNLSLTEYFDTELKRPAAQIKKSLDSSLVSLELKNIAKNHKALVFKVTKNRVEFLKAKTIDDKLIELTEELMPEKEVFCWTLPKDAFSFIAQGNAHIEDTRPTIVVSRNLTDDEKLNDSSPYAKLFKEALYNATEKGVSDIHIEPKENGIDIRFRLHGYLSTYKTLSKDHRESFLATVKNIVNMELSIVGRPQDSRASFQALKVDVRANTFPILYGEKLVLRLLERDKKFNLSKSGLACDALVSLRSVIEKKDGLILISGPTGSGKTTTLYSLLSEIDRKKKNISTLENPVEYELEGINQANIIEGGEMTFSSALRALMRQDPDVILVGEVRDKETAELCLKAASTGHLVLSTVHANGAREVIERLTSLGVSTYSVQSNLILSAAQRLIPLICPHCCISPTIEDLRKLQYLKEENNFQKLRKQNPKGCSKCDNGLIGKTAILEYVESPEIQSIISNDLETFERKNTLRGLATELALSGKIDCTEILSI